MTRSASPRLNPQGPFVPTPSSPVSFVKMHGLGNDFLVIDARHSGPGERDWSGLARRWCDRHFGVGADGLLLILPADEADARMRTINADGSEAQMCGNGIRCVARYLFEKDKGGRMKDEASGIRSDGGTSIQPAHSSFIPHTSSFSIETLAGTMRPQILLKDGAVAAIRVDMGEPRFLAGEIPIAGNPQRLPQNERLTVGDVEFVFSAVSMGNPHCVIVVADLEEVDLHRFGPAIERHPLFPQRTNVEFVQILSPGHMRVKVWERGAGPTLACGTGACGVLAITATLGLTQREATLSLPGGNLQVEWSPDGRLYMTGPAEVVCTGTILARAAG